MQEGRFAGLLLLLRVLELHNDYNRLVSIVLSITSPLMKVLTSKHLDSHFVARCIFEETASD